MKRALGFAYLALFVLGLIHFLSPRLEAQNRTWNTSDQPLDGACFYLDADYRGDSFCMNAGESRRNVDARLNDRISSVRVFGRAQVLVYEDENFGGASTTIAGDVSNLRDWNDKITAIQVQYDRTAFSGSGNDPQNGACFYLDADYRGERFCMNGGESRQNVDARLNDKISSVRVFGRIQVIVYENENFGGASTTFAGDVPNLRAWNDKITAIQVQYDRTAFSGSGNDPQNGACFYLDADYRGERFCVDSDESQQSLEGRYNDRISSIRIFGRAGVTVYEDENFNGSRRTFDQDVPNLSDWNDRITSFQVSGSPYRGQYGGQYGGQFGGRDSGYEPRNGACFYLDSDHRGDSFCMNAGEDLRNLEARFNDKISSIRFFGRARVVVHEDESFRGDSRTFTGDVSNLGNLNDRITSIEVR
jgi:hypothetical protein